MIYYATFTVCCGQSNNVRNPYKCANKKHAIKYIRELAEGQVNGLKNSSWRVDDENGKCVASGGRFNGIRYRIEL